MDLYNKYRGRTFASLYVTSDFIPVAQEIIDRTIGKRADTGPTLPHCMIFHSSFPGLGKTTCGRIIASELNPDLSDDEREAIFAGRDSTLVEEINGANFRKIDDARNLDEKVRELGSSMFGYRHVIIIDEAHKLTKDAQDVILKTTENIPENVYMIFTTTEIAHIDPYLLSRLERYHFRPLDRADLANLVKEVATAEKLVAPDRSIHEALYAASHGCPRGALVAFSKYLKTGKIPEEVEIDDEKKTPEFKELMHLFIMLADGKSVSWTREVAPKIESMIQQHNPEEIRIKLMTRIGGMLMDGSRPTVKVAEFLVHAGNILKNPIVPPQKSDIYHRLFSLFMQTKQ